MNLLNATRSELTKQFTTAIWWILALVLLVYIGGTATALAASFGSVASGALPGADAPSLAPAALPGIVYSVASALGYIFPLLIGTLLVTGEFRHKTLTPTFLATPRRAVALAGKVVAGLVMGLLYAAVGLAATVIPGAAVLGAFGLDTRIGESDTWAMLGRIVIAYLLWMLIGIGVGTLVRNQVAAVVGVLAFTQFVEPILRTIGAFVDGVSAVTAWLPGAASDALVGASIYTSLPGAGSDVAWWAGGLALLAYAAVALVLGYLFSWRRDVT